LFFELIEAYAMVEDNLRLHADGWPTAAYLQSVVAAGQYRYGMSDVKAGHSSPGSRLIERALAKDDPRPLYVVVNAGANTLAQALVDYRATVKPEEFNRALNRLRVFENGSQDNAGAWITHQWPDIHWVRSNYQTYAYGGPSRDGGKDNQGDYAELGPHTWGDYEYSGLGQHQWALQHVKGNHGPLAGKWPIRQFPRGGVSFIEGGGSIPWLALVNKGLYDMDHPWWGGWGGRYTREKQENYWSKHASIRTDEENSAPFYVYGEESETWINPEDGTVWEDSLYAPVWRWRRAMFNNQAARADWGIKSFDEANHHPVAAIGGDASNTILRMTPAAGETLEFDASASTDPDGDDIAFSWWIYHEAGTYETALNLESASASKITFPVPKDASGRQIHLVLEIVDNSEIFPLYDYRRIVLDVR
jgi:hypothetical protein